MVGVCSIVKISPTSFNSLFYIDFILIYFMIDGRDLLTIGRAMTSIPRLRPPLHCRVWFEMSQTAEFVCRIFWLHFWKVGGGRDALSIFINSLWPPQVLQSTVLKAPKDAELIWSTSNAGYFFFSESANWLIFLALLPHNQAYVICHLSESSGPKRVEMKSRKI